jgi:hypothetical protein
MPLPEPEARDWLNLRTVECRGFRRHDGLFEIEGRLVDLRTYTYPSRERGNRPAGEPVHDMWLRLTLDDDLVVREVACSMDAVPIRFCGDIEPAYQKLVGLRIASGWTRKIRDLLAGSRGCTHLMDLLTVITGTVIQTVGGYRDSQAGRAEGDGRTPQATCHALARKAAGE